MRWLRPEIPEQTVVARSFLVGLDLVGVEELGFPSRALVPLRTPGRYGEVGPSVCDAEAAEIDMANPAAVIIDEGIRGAGVPVADDDLIDGWHVGDEFESLVDSEMLMVRVPPSRVELTCGASMASDSRTLFCRPGERTVPDRQSVVKGPQTSTDRLNRPRRIRLPPVRNSSVTVEAGRDNPGTVLVTALVKQSRHWCPPDRPTQPFGLPTQIDPTASRRPFHEPPTRFRPDLEREATEFVLPHDADRSTGRHLPNRVRYLDTPKRSSCDHQPSLPHRDVRC